METAAVNGVKTHFCSQLKHCRSGCVIVGSDESGYLIGTNGVRTKFKYFLRQGVEGFNNMCTGKLLGNTSPNMSTERFRVRP
jgi:hypothetical protein